MAGPIEGLFKLGAGMKKAYDQQNSGGSGVSSLDAITPSNSRTSTVRDPASYGRRPATMSDMESRAHRSDPNVLADQFGGMTGNAVRTLRKK